MVAEVAEVAVAAAEAVVEAEAAAAAEAAEAEVAAVVVVAAAAAEEVGRPTAGRELEAPDPRLPAVAGRRQYSLVNQKVQSSVGSTASIE